MRDTGAFYLYEIVFSAMREDGGPIVQSLSARCNHCRHSFLAAGPPLVTVIGDGGAAVECPRCGERQGVAGAFFRAFVAEPSRAGHAEDQHF